MIDYESRKVETGKRIKYEREKAGLSKKELLVKIYMSESSHKTLSSWENGKSLPDLNSLARMADLFGCDIGYLLCDYDERTRDIADAKYRPFPSSLYHSWQKMRVCRLPENTSQAVLQGCAVSGEGGVYHKIAAAETVWVFYLANKVRNAFLFGKALINGDRSDINQIVEPGGLCHVLIHTEKLLSYQTSKSHECAGSMEAPSARYLTLEAPLRPFA